MKKFLITIGIILSFLVMLYLKPSFNTVYEVPTRSELLRLTNIERQKVGAQPLIEDIRLDASAQIKADDMFNNGYFNHVDSNGKHGYEYIEDTAPKLCQLKSENLRANSYINNNSSAITIKSLVGSPKHYQAMVNKEYNLVGFGISGTKVVQHFCKTF